MQDEDEDLFSKRDVPEVEGEDLCSTREVLEDEEEDFCSTREVSRGGTSRGPAFFVRWGLVSLWPEFTQPTAIGADRSWTARFESFDQRNDDCYYEITLWMRGAPEKTIWGRVTVGYGRTNEETETSIRRDLHRIAASGAANTEYTGSMVTKMKRRT